jgi:hypothetical protein
MRFFADWFRSGALALAVLTATALPCAAARAAAPAAIGQARSFSLNGRITSVDYDMNVMVVNTRGGDVSIVITPTTVVEHSGEVSGVSDLRPGEHVHVSGTSHGGVMTAVSITIK